MSLLRNHSLKFSRVRRLERLFMLGLSMAVLGSAAQAQSYDWKPVTVKGGGFVTGLGENPPRHPHDRRSGGDHVSAPWPGYLVGGQNPRATDWRDEQGDFRTNEIAINWNGALIYALAGLLEDGDRAR